MFAVRDFETEQTAEHTEPKADWFVCAQAEDELNISPGLSCCCGCVWEDSRVRVRQRAAVAMVSTGLEGYYGKGGICQGLGEVGVLQHALLSRPATAYPLPSLPRPPLPSLTQ